MDIIQDLSDLPTDHSRKVIKEILEKENLNDYRVTVSGASKKGDNYLGDLYRINITGRKSNGKPGSLDLVLKLSPDDPVVRKNVPYNKFYKKEVYAYTKIIPHFNQIQDEYKVPKKNQFMTAKCISASYEEFKEFVLMEDLGSRGFVLFDRLKSLDYEHLSLCIKNLAALHALSFVMIEKEPVLLKQMVDDSCQFIGLSEGFIKLFTNAAIQTGKILDDEVCVKKLQDYMKDPYEKLCNFLDTKAAAPYNVVCHGDCWSNNFLFRYEENQPVEMRTVDWQITRYASPVTDITYLLFTSTDEETRRKYYPAILDLYHETLGKRLAAMDCDVEKCYPKEVFMDQVNRILPYGLLMSLALLPLIQSDRGNAPEIMDMVGDGDDKENKNALSKNCIDRMRGVVKDFVRYKMI